MVKRIIGIAALVACVPFCALIVSLAISLVELQKTASAFQTNNSIDAYMQQQMIRLQVPAVSLSLVENGEIRYTPGYSLNSNIPITSASLFQLASVSKPLTAWGIMHLVETGQVELDVPVTTYLKRWTFAPSPWNVDEITVRRLLSHTAGLSVAGYAGFMPDQLLQTLEQSLNGALDVQNNEAVELIAAPGSAWRYSGGGYTVLQLLIEEVTGQSFATYMQQNVLAPLGMQQSGYYNETPTRLVPVFDATGHEQPAYRFTALAAGGAYSTAEDMAIWLKAMVNHKAANGILTAQTFAQMLEPQPATQTAWGEAFGLGYKLEHSLFGNIKIASHDGSNLPGWRTHIAVIPETNAGLAVLTDSPGGAVLHYQATCGWILYSTGTVTADCLAHYASSVLPTTLLAVAIMTFIGILLLRRKLAAHLFTS